MPATRPVLDRRPVVEDRVGVPTEGVVPPGDDQPLPGPRHRRVLASGRKAAWNRGYRAPGEIDAVVCAVLNLFLLSASSELAADSNPDFGRTRTGQCVQRHFAPARDAVYQGRHGNCRGARYVVDDAVVHPVVKTD